MGTVPALLGLGEALVTVFVNVVLLLQLEQISYLARVAAEAVLASGDLRGLRWSPVVHATGGLVALLLAATLSVYKPRGFTRYGWRKQHASYQPAVSF